MPAKGLEIIHLQGDMDEIGRHSNRAGRWKMAEFEHFPADRWLKEYQGTASRRGASGNLPHAKNLGVEPKG